MKTPLLSVVIPAWNRAGLVCDAVESALAQSPGRVEVIVVDDGSTDGTADLLARRFGRALRLLRSARRRGVGAARNAGARLARGEMLGFLDSDDLWLRGKLDAELAALESFQDAEAVVSDSLSFNEGRAEGQSRFERNGLLAATRGRARLLDECRWLWTNSLNGVAVSSIIMRRGAARRLGDGPFAEDIIRCEDWEFQMRVYHSCRVVVLPEVWTQVRRFDDGSRPGRAMPGTRCTRAQEIGLLRDRLTVMGRSHWLAGLDDYLADELERFRAETARRLERLSKEVG